MRISCLFGLVLLIPSLGIAQNKKEALVVGAGGEPSERSYTIFDHSYGNTMESLNAGGWKTQSFYNGGHRDSEQIADSVTDYTNRAFQKEDFEKAIDGYIERIKQGDLKSGDQLLVSMMTHGWPPQAGDKTHSISTSEGTMNLDKLEVLRDLAEKNGVRLAILDMSCYSGHSLKMASDKTCVLSLATDDNLGWTNASAALGAAMDPGSNLEEAFLKMRTSKRAQSPGQPQISTKAGLRAMEQVKVLQYSMQQKENYNNQVCSLNTEPTQKLLMQLRDIRDGLADGDAIAQELQTSVKAYNDLKIDLQQNLKRIESAGNKKTCISYSTGQTSCIPLDNFEKIWTQNFSVLSLEERELYRKVRSSPSFQTWMKDRENYEKNLKQLYELSGDVIKAEQKAYAALYNKYAKEDNSPNPCRDFKL